MTYSPQSQAKPPTDPQLALIPKLCQERGVSFDGPPRSAQQADGQIKALLAMPRLAGDRLEDVDAVHTGFGEWGGATAVREDEMVGYGSTARWRCAKPVSAQNSGCAPMQQ
jgi:hypothetical protein